MCPLFIRLLRLSVKLPARFGKLVERVTEYETWGLKRANHETVMDTFIDPVAKCYSSRFDQGIQPKKRFKNERAPAISQTETFSVYPLH
jgi:hypothetical protein